jgi:GLPGLI family protein
MRLLFALLFLAAAPAALAQHGTIRYEVVNKIDIELPPEMAAMRDQIPSEVRSERLLHFTPDAALSLTPPREQSEEGSSRIAMRFAGQSEDERMFTDLEAGTTLQTRSFLRRPFLISGEPKTMPWRITGEQSMFLGQPAMQAVATRDSVTYEAWFAPALAVPVGPDGYGGLPGVILLLTVDGGKTTYAAQEIRLDAPDPAALVPPTEGQAVTQEEFDVIFEEKMEEMRQARGGRSGGIIVRSGGRRN